MTKSEIKIDDFFKEEELPVFMAWIIRALGRFSRSESHVERTRESNSRAT